MLAATIGTSQAIKQKEELLELMKDMLELSKSGVFESAAAAKYAALRCKLTFIEPSSYEFQSLKDFVIDSQVHSKDIKIKRLFKIEREKEITQFKHNLDPVEKLFHGSRISNWVGLLSRGLLLPQVAVARLGVRKSAAQGWLGDGLYFGNAADTAGKYCTPGENNSRLMMICKVALGLTKDYTKITYGLTSAPSPFNSTHGIRATPGVISDFTEDEFVIYDDTQQHQHCLIEFTI
eukprot:TRINITY_DN401_c0_g1_i1.p1 TRINITY_DN401_c0_g1~~TRINITY_DN401_c0_g1_i1.p1  ORF type:complete len:235 (-),score=125.18 TRINITY_DN401_c0_g1_i1:270-974(-)